MIENPGTGGPANRRKLFGIRVAKNTSGSSG
jgi:hypothetical protein